MAHYLGLRKGSIAHINLDANRGWVRDGPGFLYGFNLPTDATAVHPVRRGQEVVFSAKKNGEVEELLCRNNQILAQ